MHVGAVRRARLRRAADADARRVLAAVADAIPVAQRFAGATQDIVIDAWRIEAATVDHALRPGSREEAKGVATLCAHLGVPHHILTVEWVAVKSDIGDDEITYSEEGRIVEKDLPARASFILKRLGERRTFLQFHAKWLGPEPPREMTNAVLADYKQGLETIKMLCEKP